MNDPTNKNLQQSFTAFVLEMHEELGKKALRTGRNRAVRALQQMADPIAKREIPQLSGYAEIALYKNIFSRVAGFSVGVPASLKLPNRFGEEMPWPYWLEHGTAMRMTSGQPKAKKNSSGKREIRETRKAHSTGRIRSIASMETAEREINIDSLDSIFIEECEKCAERIIRKYGK